MLKLSISTLIVALLAVTASTIPAVASNNAAVMATVHQFVDGFNKGDTKMAVAACATPASIIDEFPPHVWEGPNACADWARDSDANDKSTGVTGGFVTLRTPWQVQVTGDRAYVVVPATYSYKVKGKNQTESGSIFTLALKKTAAGWRITAWAWAAH